MVLDKPSITPTPTHAYTHIYMYDIYCMLTIYIMALLVKVNYRVNKQTHTTNSYIIMTTGKSYLIHTLKSSSRTKVTFNSSRGYLLLTWFNFIYPFPIFNGCAVEVWKSIRIYIPRLLGLWLLTHAGIKFNQYWQKGAPGRTHTGGQNDPSSIFFFICERQWQKPLYL